MASSVNFNTNTPGGCTEDSWAFDVKEAKVLPGTLLVYPNPFNDLVQFSAPLGATITTLRITDLSGKTVFAWKQASGASSVTWQTKATKEGVYFYQAQLATGEKMYGKLLQIKTP